MGIGSGLSTRLAPSRRAVGRVAAIAAVALAALPWAVIHPLAVATQASALPVRAAWAAALAAGLGLVLGILFPAAARCLDRREGVALALGINGAAGVMGGVLATVISVWAGIPESFFAAAGFYALAAACGPAFWRQKAAANPSVQ
jgi:hypothetical protein